ncbi:MAG: triose-phosphate isomerase [Firmicutes bacterium]|nr:triose-phosphate isomerase [Bacillota bacterium]
MRKKFICGNWKMFAPAWEGEIPAFAENKIVAVAPPFTELSRMSERLKGTGIKLAAQNVYFKDNGAYTGEISAEMLKNLGVSYCIVGHSERRGYFGETDEDCLKKIEKLAEYGIAAILCVGESLETREAGDEYKFVGTQVEAIFENISPAAAENIVVAYEPIWAIGTGKTASAEQAQEMCAHIRATIAACKGSDYADGVLIQYGGSVKPSNAAELLGMEDIDGALVGGASLEPASFMDIVNY